jgi:hypothetical protein
MLGFNVQSVTTETILFLRKKQIYTEEKNNKYLAFPPELNKT